MYVCNPKWMMIILSCWPFLHDSRFTQCLSPIQIVRKSVQDSPSLPCICNPFLGSQDIKIHWSPSPDLTGCSNKVATGCRRNDQWRLPHRPSRRYLRCSFITPASHVHCGGAKATETASLEPVGNCSLFNRCKVGGAATAKMFEPVVRFWLEAKELTHHSLQGDTALGRNDQKTAHSHWVGPPAEAKLLISILLFGIGQSFHDTDLLHDANLLPCSHGSAEHLRVTYKNKNTSSKAYLLHMCPLNCQHLATNMSCKWGLVSWVLNAHPC